MLEKRETLTDEILKEFPDLLIYSKDRYIEGNAYELVRIISEKPFKQEFVRGILLRYSRTELVFLTIKGNKSSKSRLI